MNLRPPGCECLDLADRMRYELEQVAPPLCKVHDVQAIAQREAARLRAEADAGMATLRLVRESLREPPPPCTCPDLTTSLRASLEGVGVGECAAHPATPSDPSSSLSLNGDPLLRSLKASLGIPADPDPSGGDLPPAA